MIVCVFLPRFELTVAAGGAEALAGGAVAIEVFGVGAPRVGEVSGAAEVSGVRVGMGLSEALSCCPDLRLVRANPIGVARAWEQVARALEGIGALIEADPRRPGVAYFDADGLEGLYGGREGVIAAARRAVGRPCRIGVGPTRFCALAASRETRSRSVRIVGEREVRRYLAKQPVRLLAYREEVGVLVPALEQLGIDTLGKLAGFGAGEIADRFGHAGSEARRLALGHDTPLLTRRVQDRIHESMALGESNSGQALERTLGVLIDRLLARPECRGRLIRSVTLSARLVESGTWSEPVVFREPLADRGRIALAVGIPLRLIPAPADALALSVRELGAAGGGQATLLDGERAERTLRLRGAVAQVRALAGPHALLRVIQLDPDSRLRERHSTYGPFLP